MDTPRPWYKKKRFIIPIAAFSLFTALSIADTNTPSAVQNTQQVTPIVEQRAVSAPATIQTPEVTPVVEQKTETPKAQPKIETAPYLSNDNYYENVDGNEVHSPAYTSDDSIPAGASAQCRDGTYSFSQNRRGTCSHHGGVATWY